MRWRGTQDATRGSTSASEADLPSSGATTGHVPVRDPAASMALIFDAMRNPVDPLYEDVARRRAVVGEARPVGRTPLLLVTMILMGLLMGVAAHTLRTPKTVADDPRAQLVKQVQAKQAANDKDLTALSDLRTSIATEQSAALKRSDKSGVTAQLAAAEKAAGTGPTSGAGITMTLANPPTAVPGDSADSNPRTGDQTETITSADLQQVVNALWASGASAIAVNDQRITSLSAIRFAGAAILVNFRPLTTPYTVSAIGPSNMRKRFEGGFGGAYVEGMRRSGFTVNTADSGTLKLPGVSSVRLTHALPKR